MADKKNDNVYKLWHERLEASDINKMATELVKKFLKAGVKLHTINVEWDEDGNFFAHTQGAFLKRRIEDKKTPDPSR